MEGSCASPAQASLITRRQTNAIATKNTKLHKDLIREISFVPLVSFVV